MTKEDSEKDVPGREGGEGEYDEQRRTFLKVAVATSAVLAVGAVASLTKSISNPAPQTQTAQSGSFPRVRVANVADLQVNQPVTFNYPLDNEPNVIVKLGQKAEGGVGPDGDIVAFSQVCQHLGCVYAYVPSGDSPSCNSSYAADRPVGYCCCHGSTYDFLKGAQVIGGPSLRPQPQVVLEVDSSGEIYATGMTPPTVFGHDTGSNDVSADLRGGTPVG